MSNTPNTALNQILSSYNTVVPYEHEICIHKKLEGQAILTPDKLAVSYKQENLTYDELNNSANKVANVLLNKNIQIEDYVIVFLERGIELIPSIYGVLKSGGVYVPVTTSTPHSRIKSIIDDTQAKFVITSSGLVDSLPKGSFDILLADSIVNDVDNKLTNQPNVNVESSNLAYAIFTSGTTGKPKGVLIEHHSVMNRIGWMQKEYPINSEDVLIQKTPISFDVSIWELFWWSFVGAKLVLLENGHEKDPMKLIECISKEEVSVVHFVPSMFNTFLMSLNSLSVSAETKLKSIKWLFCSGEELHSESVEEFYKICIENNVNTTVVNLYGPTEATVDVTYHTCEREIESPIPIGKPIDNIELFVVNEENEIIKDGEVGELFISGVGLAREYLKRPEITNEKFISLLNDNGESIRAYRTGDFASWTKTGELEYKGRIDGQIKLRGNRIELSEIENSILSFTGVGECACVLNDKGTDSAHIIAFIVGDSQLDGDKLNSYLMERLPSYMLPSKYEVVGELPLSANGKLDRETLLSEYVGRVSDTVDPILSKTDYERKLQKIWSQLFGKPKINPVVNFFDLGGNSLLLVQSSLLIKQELDVDVDVITLMQYPSIRLLSEYISSLQVQ